MVLHIKNVMDNVCASLTLRLLDCYEHSEGKGVLLASLLYTSHRQFEFDRFVTSFISLYLGEHSGL